MSSLHTSEDKWLNAGHKFKNEVTIDDVRNCLFSMIIECLQFGC